MESCKRCLRLEAELGECRAINEYHFEASEAHRIAFLQERQLAGSRHTALIATEKRLSDAERHLEFALRENDQVRRQLQEQVQACANLQAEIRTLAAHNRENASREADAVRLYTAQLRSMQTAINHLEAQLERRR
jgi:exonuclease VII large subunit